MTTTRRACLATFIAGTVAGGIGLPTWAATAPVTIQVSLWDKGATSMNMLNDHPMLGMGMRKGMAQAGKPQGMGSMGIKVSTHKVHAGTVTFEVTNASKDMVHEMVISPVKSPGTELPYEAANNKVNEDAAGHLGEVAELEPGKSGALKIDLKPGQYILYCNIPGHYILGMWTLLDVSA